MPLLGTIGEASARGYALYSGYQFQNIDIPLTIASNTNTYDVYANRGPTYIPGISRITVTVNPGVTVGATSTGTYAMLVPSAFSPLDTVTIVNNGVISGAGGPGGACGNVGVTGGNGNTGGSALFLQRPTTINNLGTIAGGGGGGGGGGAYYVVTPRPSRTGGPFATAYDGGGGGGAGGTVVGTGAAGGGGSSAGTPGTATTGGVGGPSSGGGTGGTGGNLGATGGAGVASVYAAGSGGAPGSYIVNSPFATWINVGTRLGPAA